MCGLVESLIGGLFAGSKSGGSSITVEPTSAPPSAVDVTSSGDALDATKEARKKAAAASGYQSTIRSGSAGDQSSVSTSRKQLLGG